MNESKTEILSVLDGVIADVKNLRTRTENLIAKLERKTT